MNLLVDCRLYAFVDSAYLHNRPPADLIRNHRYLWQTLDVKGDVYDHDVDVSAVAENR